MNTFFDIPRDFGPIIMVGIGFVLLVGVPIIEWMLRPITRRIKEYRRRSKVRREVSGIVVVLDFEVICVDRQVVHLSGVPLSDRFIAEANRYLHDIENERRAINSVRAEALRFFSDDPDRALLAVGAYEDCVERLQDDCASLGFIYDADADALLYQDEPAPSEETDDPTADFRPSLRLVSM